MRPRHGAARTLARAFPLVVLAWGQLHVAGYIKDDAFITLRYARNLVEGYGLVFNPGDAPLEGYSNFLWVLLEAAGLALGLEGPLLARSLSTAATALALVYTALLAGRLAPRAPAWVGALAATTLACHPTVQVWAQSGLAGPLVAAAFAGAFHHVLRSGHAGAHRAFGHLVAAGAWSLIAALTRPEGHLLVVAIPPVALAVAAPRSASVSWWRCGRWDRASVFGVVVALLAAYHAWRLAYFGDFLPNPYYVKTAGGWSAVPRGLRYVSDMLGFAGLGPVLAVAAMGTLPRRMRPVRLAMGGLVAVFLLYLVRVGRDEMPFYRLFLPVLPLAYALAASALSEGTERLSPRIRFAHALAALPVLALAAAGMAIFLDAGPVLRRTHAGLVDAHQAMARFIRERSKPGDRVVFQDMGAAPYAAGDLRWIDPLGVLDRRIAHAQHRAGINPFVARTAHHHAAGPKAVEHLHERLRDDLFGRDPEWIAGVAYVKPAARAEAFARAYREATARAREPGGTHTRLVALLVPRLHANPHYGGLFADRRFRLHYRYVRSWRRKDSYYLVLFRRATSLADR